METKNDNMEKNSPKTKIYNLIILDESGSMLSARQQTIDGCNETINTIRASQASYGDKQDHYVSIYVFQQNPQNPSHYVVKNVHANEVQHISEKDYKPSGCTPLYDAIGTTLSELKSLTDEMEDAIGSVTIITDGYENASREYSVESVVNMIDALKEVGWNFNFIGANIDVKQASFNLHIDNAMEFKSDAEGTRRMFEKERKSRMAYHSRLKDVMSCFNHSMPKEERYQRLKEASRDYFDKDE